MIFLTSPTPPDPAPIFTPETFVILFCVLIIAYSAGLLTLHFIAYRGRKSRQKREDKRIAQEDANHRRNN